MELDIDQLVVRFNRVDRAVSLGVATLASNGAGQLADADASGGAAAGPAVRLALADAADEAVRLAEVGLRLAAEEDLWPLLRGVLALWARSADMLQAAAQVDAPVRCEVSRVRTVADQLAQVQHRVELVERALEELAAHPADRSCDAAAQVAIADLLAAGDVMVASALAEPGTTRLDAAVAALQSVAARGGSAERRRRWLRSEASPGA